VTKRPRLFDRHAKSPASRITPAEASRPHGDGRLEGWIDQALLAPPSAGPLGRMDLLRHWNRLSGDEKKALLSFAREIGK